MFRWGEILQGTLTGAWVQASVGRSFRAVRPAADFHLALLVNSRAQTEDTQPCPKAIPLWVEELSTQETSQKGMFSLCHGDSGETEIHI